MARLRRLLSILCVAFILHSQAHATTLTVNLVNKNTAAAITVPGTNNEKISCSNSRYSFEPSPLKLEAFPLPSRFSSQRSTRAQWRMSLDTANQRHSKMLCRHLEP